MLMLYGHEPLDTPPSSLSLDEGDAPPWLEYDQLPLTRQNPALHSYRFCRLDQFSPPSVKMKTFKYSTPFSSDDSALNYFYRSDEELFTFLPMEPQPTSARPSPDSSFSTRFSFERKKNTRNALHFRAGLLTLHTQDKEVLELQTITNFRAVDDAMRAVMQLRDSQRLTVVESAVLTVLVLRHRVLIIDDGPENIDRRFNGWKSFPKDVAGNWCQPSGDLLLFPGFHRKPHILEEVFTELLHGMQLTNSLRGTLARTNCRRVSADTLLAEPTLGILSSIGSKYSKSIAKFNLVFKPIFTTLYYKMDSVKQRLAAEFYQTGILALLKLADWALTSKDYAAAACFTHKMQQCLIVLDSLLPGEDVFVIQSYLYTMCHWMTARCYFELSKIMHETTVYQCVYNALRVKMVEFTNEVFIKNFTSKNHMAFPYNTDFQFPTKPKVCLKITAQAYSLLAIPGHWHRSTFQKETSTCSTYLEDLCSITGSHPWGSLREQVPLTDRLHDFQKIGRGLDQLRNITGGTAHYRIFVNCIFAKACRYSVGLLASKFMEHPQFKTFRLREDHVATDPILLRSYIQREALSTMVNEYLALRSEVNLRILFRMIQRSVCDEVFYAIEYQDDIRDVTVNVENLWRLLPVVVGVWFRPNGRREANSSIPPEDEDAFNHTMAMCFTGLALCHHLMYLSKDHHVPKMKHNAQYLLTVAAIFLRREGAFVSVFQAFLSHALLMEHCCLLLSGDLLRYKAVRALMVVRRLVWLLPVLYEYSIFQGGEVAPPEYYAVLLEGSSLLSSDILEPVAGVSDLDRDVYIKLVSYIEKQLGFDPAASLQVLEGKALNKRNLKSQTLHFHIFAFTGNQDPKLNFSPRYCEDTRPPIQGRHNCVYEECTIESYHEKEETDFQPPADYNEDLFDKTFKDVAEAIDDEDESIFSVLNRIKVMLKRLLVIAVNNLQEIITEVVSNAIVEEIVETEEASWNANYNMFHSPTFLRTELQILLRNLDDTEYVLAENVTRALYKLDRLLNRSLFPSLLRGGIDI